MAKTCFSLTSAIFHTVTGWLYGKKTTGPTPKVAARKARSAKKTNVEKPQKRGKVAAKWGSSKQPRVDKRISLDSPQVNAAVHVSATGLPEVLGQIQLLMMNSPAHRHLFLADFDWLLMPALRLKQFRLFRQKQGVFGFVPWALVSEDVDAWLRQGVRKLQPADWHSGDRLWLIDMIVPDTARDTVINELREKIFPGQAINSCQPTPDGQSFTVKEWEPPNNQPAAE